MLHILNFFSADVQKNKDYCDKLDRLCGSDTTSILAMPVTDEHGATLGVIQAANRFREDGERGVFNEHDIYLLDCVASVAGNVSSMDDVYAIAVIFFMFSFDIQALSKLKLYIDAKRAAKVQSKMLFLTKKLAAEVEISRIVKTVIDGVYSLLNVDNVKVFLVPADGSRVFLLDIRENDEELSLRTKRVFEVPRGLVGTSVEYRQTICVDAAATRPDYDEDVDGWCASPKEGQSPRHNRKVSSCVCIPVRDPNNKVVAVIEVINKKEHKVLPRRSSYDDRTETASESFCMDDKKDTPVVSFHRNDIELLESIATSFGVCLHKWMLFSEISRAQRKTATLLEIIKTTSMQADLSRFVRRMIHSLYKAIHADKITLFLVDNPRKALQAVVSKDIRGQRLYLDQGICGYVARTGREVVLSDAYQSEYFNEEIDKATNYRTRSVLCLPIFDNSNRVMAVLEALNKVPPHKQATIRRHRSTRSSRHSLFSPTVGVNGPRHSDTHGTRGRIRSGSGACPISTGLSRSYSVHSDGHFPNSPGDAAEAKDEAYSEAGSPRKCNVSRTKSMFSDKTLSLKDGRETVLQFSSSPRNSPLRPCFSAETMSPQSSPGQVRSQDVPNLSLNEEVPRRIRHRSGSMLEAPATQERMQAYSLRRDRSTSVDSESQTSEVPTSEVNIFAERLFAGSELCSKDLESMDNDIFSPLVNSETTPDMDSFGLDDVAITKACCLELSQRFSRSAPEEILFELRSLYRGADTHDISGLDEAENGKKADETMETKPEDERLESLFASYTSSSAQENKLSRSRSVIPWDSSKSFEDIPESSEISSSSKHRKSLSTFVDFKSKSSRSGLGGKPRSAPFLEVSYADVKSDTLATSVDSLSASETDLSFETPQTVHTMPARSPSTPPPPPTSTENGAYSNQESVSSMEVSMYTDPKNIIKFAENVSNETVKRILSTGTAPVTTSGLSSEYIQYLVVEVEKQAQDDERCVTGEVSPPSTSTLQLPSLDNGQLESFRFDVFNASSHILVPSVLLMVHRLGALSHLPEVEAGRIIDYSDRISRLYRPEQECPFHNFLHGFSVCQFTYALLVRMNPRAMLLPIEQLSVLLAALAHDVDHPSVTNNFLIAADTELALQYNDQAVLESYHASVACRIMKATNLLEGVSKETSRRSRNVIIQTILATDMSRHFDLIKDIKQWNDSSLCDRDFTEPHSNSVESDSDDDLITPMSVNDGVSHTPFPTVEKRGKICEVLLHCADLSGQVMPWNLAKEWSARITAEFARQNNLEKRLSLEETPHLKGLDSEKAQQELQIGFCDYVVAPLWRALSEICEAVEPCVRQLEQNSQEYQRLANAYDKQGQSTDS